MLKDLKEQFYNPSEQFSMFPFWFLNDDLNKEDILNKMIDFKSKGVDGFVIHPRIGLPHDMEYLGPQYMEFVKFIVEKAKEMNIKVILYDEGMYPSGSANGKLVKSNPEFAARGLRMVEYECKKCTEICEKLDKGEKIVLAATVKKLPNGTLDLSTAVKLKEINGKFSFIPEDREGWSVIILISTFSKGTIRGIHFGEDDGEENAPPAGDLLNYEAMKKFIEITHDEYYSVLKEYFGETIIAMFTDEPSILGRCVDTEKIKPWTVGFMEFYKELGNDELDLLSLWFDVGIESEIKRRNFKKTVNERLKDSYYKQISDWCKKHGIALTGHPAASSDIGVLKYFQIPGQDLVWRWVAPENNKAIEGIDSTLGKCSSDAARHLGRRRNSNECFGCCGPKGNPWEFSPDDMKWYMDWLFVRGVNMLYPHAFFYSIRGEKRLGERPPDVGPNNFWWEYYKSISTYAKRMSWLLTDSFNVTNIAVLCEEDNLPWKITKPLYENQIEFNYLEDSILLDFCKLNNGFVEIEKQRYSVILIEDLSKLSDSINSKLEAFIKDGGQVIAFNNGNNKCSIKDLIEIRKYEAVVNALDKLQIRDVKTSLCTLDLRVTHIVKDKVDFYIFVNEGEKEISTDISINLKGYLEKWDAVSGKIEELSVDKVDENYVTFPLKIERRASSIISVNKSQNVAISKKTKEKLKEKDVQLNKVWVLKKPSGEKTLIEKLISWTEIKDMRYFSGKVIYEVDVNLPEKLKTRKIEIDLGEVSKTAKVYINDEEVGVKLWSPYVFNITKFVNESNFKLTVEVISSLSNKILKTNIKSGILGPVILKLYY